MRGRGRWPRRAPWRVLAAWLVLAVCLGAAGCSEAFPTDRLFACTGDDECAAPHVCHPVRRVCVPASEVPADGQGGDGDAGDAGPGDTGVPDPGPGDTAAPDTAPPDPGPDTAGPDTVADTAPADTAADTAPADTVADTAPADTGEDADVAPPAPAMVEVPAGSFVMGCNEGVDEACEDDELPPHEVTLGAFLIDRLEVSAGDYAACEAAGGCQEPENAGFVAQCNHGEPGREAHPINCVTWEEAFFYCKWAGKRLPTEAEWERAARGTDGRRYPWGNPDPDPSLAWSGKPLIEGTVEVDAFGDGASPVGALQMAGNVWEWVQDGYDSDFYAASPAEDPVAPAASTRVLRGGAYISPAHELRTSERHPAVPALAARDPWTGFRCAKDP